MTRTAGCLALLLMGCGDAQTIQPLDPGWARMLKQPRADAYEQTPVFPDRAVLQEPPAGTVPFDAPAGSFAFTRGITDEGFVKRIPMDVTMDVMRRGKNRFEIFCAPCHGVLGNGESVVATNMELRPPASLHTDEMRGEPPGEVYHTISNGFGLMPAYAAQLSHEDRWAVVAYVRALQLSQHAALVDLPADLRARAKERLP